MASSECSEHVASVPARAAFSVARSTAVTGELMSGLLYVGAAAPVQTVFDVTSSGGEFDLSTIASARLLVRFANGSSAEWPATVSGATATSARLTRVHEVADIPPGVEGSARIRADVTLTGVAEPVRTRWRPVEILRDGV